MSRGLVIRPEAERDLADAFTWYERQRAGLGRRFLDRIADSLDSVSESPLSYPKTYHEFRRALIRRFPYGLFYLVEPDRIVIAAVIHTHRDPNRLKSRLANS